MSRWCFVHCLYCIVQAVSSHIRRAQLYHHRHQYQKMTSYKAGHSTTTSNTVSIHPFFLRSKWHLVGDLSDCIIHPVHDLPMSRENPKRECEGSIIIISASYCFSTLTLTLELAPVLVVSSKPMSIYVSEYTRSQCIRSGKHSS